MKLLLKSVYLGDLPEKLQVQTELLLESVYLGDLPNDLQAFLNQYQARMTLLLETVLSGGLRDE